MESLALHYLTLWRPLGYALIFFGMIIEGDITLFIALFLTHQGFFDFGDAILAVFSGVCIGDFLWYRIGIRLNGRPSFFSSWIERLSRPFDNHLVMRPLHTIFLSKFAYGLNHVALMRSGMLGVQKSKLFKSDFSATVLWVSIVGGFGYFSSASLLLAKHYIRFAEFALLAALIIFFALEGLLKRYVVRKL